MIPGDGHLGDLLSALLDGELPAPERDTARRHLDGCGTCSAELGAVGRARAVVRALPAVDPPTGFIERMLAGGSGGVYGRSPRHALRRRARRHPRRSVMALGATAAASVVVVGLVSPPAPLVAPAVARLVEIHAAGAPSESPGVRLVTAGALSGDFAAPRELSEGYRQVGTSRGPDGVQVRYSNGVHDLSVFEQRGRLDDEALPPDGGRVPVGDVSGWHHPWGDGHVVTWQVSSTVFTAVSDAPVDQMLAVAAGLRPGGSSRSFVDRFRQACRALVEPFAA